MIYLKASQRLPKLTPKKYLSSSQKEIPPFILFDTMVSILQVLMIWPFYDILKIRIKISSDKNRPL